MSYPRQAGIVAEYVGLDPDNFYLQPEGFNPSRSFKDNGMATALTHAKMIGSDTILCASTGNTAGSAAAYAANERGMRAIVLLGEGRVAPGKISQALAHGAKVLQIRGGNFDDAMKVVEQLKGVYVVNSINPARPEGQETIVYRMHYRLGRLPEYIFFPLGNAGNCAAFGRALDKLSFLRLMPEGDMPKLVAVTAKGACSALHELYNGRYNGRSLRWNNGRVDDSLIREYYEHLEREGIKPETGATAIEIARPANLKKALRSLDSTNGMVLEVDDEEMADAAAVVARNGVFGEVDLASAATVAGIKKARETGAIPRSASVVGVLTGGNKDPERTIEYHQGAYGYSNRPVTVKNDPEAIRRYIEGVKATA